MKHNTLTKIITLALAAVLALSLAACGSKTNDDSGDKTDAPVIKIGVPNDTTNEARALLLLQENGIIKLKDGVGITATKNDIVENPHNVEIVEAEAAQLPNLLPDVDYAVINSNYAINAGLNPVNDSLLIEGSASAYANILTVKEGNETSPKALALKAALESKQVADFITEKYAGSVVSVVENPTDGYDASVDYDALKGETITVAASPTPHAEILNAAKDILAEQGITLEVVEFSDYVQPNLVTESGEVDANYFQHTPYLESFNEENGTHLVAVGKIHYEPFGIYAGKSDSLDELADGAEVLVPNDVTNEARALLLLQDQGLLTLKEDAGLTATINDITENPKNLDIVELEAAQLPRSLQDADIAVINGNYAIEAGLKVTDALAVEASDSLAAQTYGNVVAVREGDEESDKTKALMEVLTSDDIKEFIETKYDGAVVPLF